MIPMPPLPAAGSPPVSLAELFSRGQVDVVDLTATLSEATPVLPLPPEMAAIPPFRLERLAHYDDPAEISLQHAIHTGEHVGTHFDAPRHWWSGRDGEDVAGVPVRRLVAPAVVLDAAEACRRDPDFLLEVEHVRSWQDRHGPLPDGGWLLFRTGWDARSHSQELFLNADRDGPHTPGVSPECARWLAEETGIAGFGVETVGTDAGQAFRFDPPFPAHRYLLGAGKYGVTQLQNLALLPATGAVLVVAPLKIAGGSGSPARALALVPTSAASG